MCHTPLGELFFRAIVTASLRTNRPKDLGRHKGLKGENPTTPYFELADQPNQAPTTCSKCNRAGHAENDTGGGGHWHTSVKGVNMRDTPGKGARPDWKPDQPAPEGRETLYR